MTLDRVREDWPEFGFAVYAFTPGAGVTLEVHAPNGDIFTFSGATEAECLGQLRGGAPIKDAELEDVFG